MVMEYCSLGSIDNYLKGMKKKLTRFTENIGEDLLAKLKIWSQEVASAMDFLSSFKVRNKTYNKG